MGVDVEYVRYPAQPVHRWTRRTIQHGPHIGPSCPRTLRQCGQRYFLALREGSESHPHTRAHSVGAGVFGVGHQG